MTKIFAPRAPHPASLADQNLTISNEDGTLLTHYCPLHKVGGIYDLESHAWTLYTPMTAAQMIAALPKLGVRVADGTALQTWIDAITATTPAALN